MRNPDWFAVPLSMILAAIAALHAYWALGGRWGIENTIPVVKGKRAFNPSPTATWVVCGLLALAVLIVVGRAGWIATAQLTPAFRVGAWGLSVVFLLRAIGDWRMVVFFKTITGTGFSRWDTWLFSPLCLVLALLAAGLANSKGQPTGT